MNHEQITEGLAMGARLKGHEEELGINLARYIAQTREGRNSLATLQFRIFWNSLTARNNKSMRRPTKLRAP